MRRLIAIPAFILAASLSFSAAAQDDPDKGTEPEPDKTAEDKVLDPYNIYSSGLFQEVYIDEDFKLFKVRTYQGAVPGRDPEDGSPDAETETPTGPTRVERIGFEQRELFSRVFVLADRSMSPWVYDNFVQAAADPNIPFQVFVELANAKIPKSNDRRPLVTRSFNTPISTIVGTVTKEGVRVVITLKRDARYLPVQVGHVVYIDVER